MDAAPANLPVMQCPMRAFDAISANADVAAWRDVPTFKLTESTAGGTPSQETRLQCAWDGAEIRVLFTCTDSEIKAEMTHRDDPLWKEEVVEIFIDPAGSGESYFEIEVNPLNTVFDLSLRKDSSGRRKKLEWNCQGFRSIVKRTDAGWNVEMAIPVAALAPEAPKPGTEWRMNFYRIDRPSDAKMELSAWSPTMAATFHMPTRFGRVQFQGKQ